MSTVTLRLPGSTEKDYWVFASDAPMRSVRIADLRTMPGVTVGRAQTKGDRAVVGLGRSARYLRVQAAGRTDLQLLEVLPGPGTAATPTVQLAAPTDGASFTAGASVRLSGSATDAEDGQLTGSALPWTVDAVQPDGQRTPFTTREGAATSLQPAADRERPPTPSP